MKIVKMTLEEGSDNWWHGKATVQGFTVGNMAKTKEKLKAHLIEDLIDEDEIVEGQYTITETVTK